MTRKQARLWYDQEADFLELQTTPSGPRRGYFEPVGKDVFVRVDARTHKVVGLAIFNLTKRLWRKHTELKLPLQLDIRPLATP